MPKPLLLFDIDGTILRSAGAGMRAMANVAGRLFGTHHTWDGIDSGGSLDPIIFAEFATRNRLDDHAGSHDLFHDHYIIELKEELELCRARVEVMPGIHEAFRIFHERERTRGDVVLGLLTGNYTKAVPLKLAAAGVDPSWFTITAFGDEGNSRPDLVALAMRKYEKHTGEKADPRKVVVIGDTPRDVACAHAHGCIALAVATGGFTVEQLRATGADVVVKDLGDLRPLLELVEGKNR